MTCDSTFLESKQNDLIHPGLGRSELLLSSVVSVAEAFNTSAPSKEAEHMCKWCHGRCYSLQDARSPQSTRPQRWGSLAKSRAGECEMCGKLRQSHLVECVRVVPTIVVLSFSRRSKSTAFYLLFICYCLVIFKYICDVIDF